MFGEILISGILVLIGVGLFLLFFMLIEAKQSSIKKIEVTIPGLPERFSGFSLYFLSDIHRRRLSKVMLRRLSQPDLIVIGGDLTEKGVPFDRVSDNLQKLKTLGAPIVFVWGNHDLQVDPYELRSVLIKHGVILLTNKTHVIEKDGQFLNLLGVHDATNSLDNLDVALVNAKEGPRLLMSHNPEVVDHIRDDHQIPLVICGHTHGGQIRIFGWGIREKGGVKAIKNGTLIISNGYGTTRYPLRLGAPPDTLLVQLGKSN